MVLKAKKWLKLAQMAPKGQKWSKFHNGPKGQKLLYRPKMALETKNGPNLPNGPKKPKMALWAKNGSMGQKWLYGPKMGPRGQKWLYGP